MEHRCGQRAVCCAIRQGVCRVVRQGAASLQSLVAGETEHEHGEHGRERDGRFGDERVRAVHH